MMGSGEEDNGRLTHIEDRDVNPASIRDAVKCVCPYPLRGAKRLATIGTVWQLPAFGVSEQMRRSCECGSFQVLRGFHTKKEGAASLRKPLLLRNSVFPEGKGAYRPPFSSSLRTALSMTVAALVQSSSLVCSGSQWDRPFSEGAKIMVVGIM